MSEAGLPGGRARQRSHGPGTITPCDNAAVAEKTSAAKRTASEFKTLAKRIIRLLKDSRIAEREAYTIVERRPDCKSCKLGRIIEQDRKGGNRKVDLSVQVRGNQKSMGPITGESQFPFLSLVTLHRSRFRAVFSWSSLFHSPEAVFF